MPRTVSVELVFCGFLWVLLLAGFLSAVFAGFLGGLFGKSCFGGFFWRFFLAVFFTGFAEVFCVPCALLTVSSL